MEDFDLVILRSGDHGQPAESHFHAGGFAPEGYGHGITLGSLKNVGLGGAVLYGNHVRLEHPLSSLQLVQ